MQIWEMKNVSDKFHSLILTEQSDENYSYLIGKFEGHEMQKPWNPPLLKYLKKRANKSDAPKCWDIHAPVFSDRAVSVLANFLENTSQILPLKHDKEIFYAINVLNIGDGFDKQNSKINFFASGEIMNIDEYFFHYDKVENQHIFKIPESKRAVFVSDVFVQAVKDHSLKGFIFKETGFRASN